MKWITKLQFRKKTNFVIGILLLILLLETSTLIILHRQLKETQNLNNLKDLNIISLQDQIQIDRRSNLPPSDLNSFPIDLNTGYWRTCNLDKVQLTIRIPEQGWDCATPNQGKRIYEPDISGNSGGQYVSINITQQTNDQIYNPSYKDINSWFNDFYSKNPNAIAEDPPNPEDPYRNNRSFFSSYTFKNNVSGEMNGYKFVYIPNLGSSSAEVLMPINNILYIFNLTGINENSASILKTIISTAEFNSKVPKPTPYYGYQY